MKAYEKAQAPRELFGEGTSLETGKRLKSWGVKKCMVITDEGLMRCGVAPKIIDAIQAEGVEVVLFDKVRSDPDDQLCIECGNTLKASGATAVVAIGGGASIDVAKMANLVATLDEEITELYPYSTSGTKLPADYKRGYMAIYITTNAGTGAESTPGALIVDPNRHVKLLIITDANQPNLAIIDPALTYGLPARQTATLAWDAIAHCVEHLIGAAQLEFQDYILYDAVTRLWRWLPVALAQPNHKEARSELSWAAHHALCNGGSSNMHAVSQAMGAVFTECHLAHGQWCALALPTAIRWHSDTRTRQIRHLANCFGLGEYETEPNEEVADRVASAIKEFYRRCGLPTLHEAFERDHVTMDKETFIRQLAPSVKADVLYKRFDPPLHESDQELYRLLEMLWDEAD